MKYSYDIGLCDVIFGACVGDALGAPVEFIKRRPLPLELVDDALQMKGGGFMDLKPGQITDDGELTICLANALLAKQDPMRVYKTWLESEPIDIGITTQNAIYDGIVDRHTQANGALMRSSPIAGVYYATKSLNEIAELAREEARRSHASEICQECNAVYCVALAYLLSQRFIHKIQINESIEKQAVQVATQYTKNATVLQWLKESQNTVLDLQEHSSENIGWVRWGFTMAFHHLYKCDRYENAMREVITRGGDTDTNACIVGAMLGAYWGIDGIPAEWVHKVAKCRARPLWLRPTAFLPKK